MKANEFVWTVFILFFLYDSVFSICCYHASKNVYTIFRALSDNIIGEYLHSLYEKYLYFLIVDRYYLILRNKSYDINLEEMSEADMQVLLRMLLFSINSAVIIGIV